MPGMDASSWEEPLAEVVGDALVADGIAPWFITGIDESWEDEPPQAAKVSASPAVTPAAARTRRRTAEREERGERGEADMAVRSFRVGARHTGART
ncbi:hypothetical protein [Streptomyces sp. MI02-7b]|uniref:hypothetical protein n=1 Tax=Streptomyces sp. MI02-7b TaxID=462941 RepID=UPI0029B10339|nr:hypothetical protein [Streptomyces sp. MI02-7b]MDX3075780.1 hypothetical protein [Streptomyces sp. MI02-7b]